MKKRLSVLMAIVILLVSTFVTPSVLAEGAPKGITLSKTVKTVYIGQNYKLKVTAVTPKSADKSVTWKSSNTKIATVSKEGIVKGIKKGTVTITATSTKNKRIKATCKINIRKLENKNLSYKSKTVFVNGSIALLYIRNSENEIHNDPFIIRTYAELQKLKRRIKNQYDICYYWDPDCVFYNGGKEEEYCIGDDIYNILDGYDKEFFKNNVLYYNCVEFTRNNPSEEKHSYSFKCTNVSKKIVNGKLTCVMNIQRNAKTTRKKMNYSNSFAYFITLNKKDVSGVQAYKPVYYKYEPFDFEYVDTVLTPY